MILENTTYYVNVCKMKLNSTQGEIYTFKYLFQKKKRGFKINDISFHLNTGGEGGGGGGGNKQKEAVNRYFAKRSSKWVSHFGTSFEVSSKINQK